MGRQKKNQIRVSFIGGNADGVTGSMILVESHDFKILLEAGLVQSNNVRNDYLSNHRRLPFKPKDIDFIFIGHVHADHTLLIPRLVKEGFSGRIVAPVGSQKFFKLMALDSAFIMSKDVETLKIKYGMDVDPIYTAEDVAACMPLFTEYSFGVKHELSDSICFRFTPSGHIISAAQCELWLIVGNQTKKILMTSDLGNVSCGKFYSTAFEPVQKANLAIGETTYGDVVRTSSKKDRQKDLEKILAVVTETCFNRRGKVLIPIFALDRCQNIMTHLYNLFASDPEFCVPILVDSPLAQKMCNLYSEVLSGDQLEQWDTVRDWDNFVYPVEYTDSKDWMARPGPCIILSASGFMQAGRSRQWAKALLPDPNAYILFVGYADENALAGKIKKKSSQKTITIDGKPYRNRCGVIDLKSFSSHMQREDLLKYYSDIDCERIALVHGEMHNKIEFAHDLQTQISKKNRSGKVICVNGSTSICL